MSDSNNPLSGAPDNKLVPAGAWKEIVKICPGGVPLAYLQEIFLIECHIAGTTQTTHIKAIEKLTANLGPGSLVRFQREPQNPHDSLAILILNEQDRKIGYVPREKNEILARLMDAGKLLFGQIVDKERIEQWLKITIKVFMRDI